MEELLARDCNLQGVIADDFEKLSKLKKFDLYGNKNMQGLPRSMKGLSQLEDMDISHCEQLVTIPELPSSSKCLHASDCYEVSEPDDKLLAEHMANQGLIMKRSVVMRKLKKRKIRGWASLILIMLV
ncbi:hypothetical protein AMTRI_Chr05g58760 [Amborella trichopoda]